MNDLILAQHVGRGYTGARGADIECFGEFHEIYARSILGPQEDGDLQANPRKSALLCVFHERKSLRNLSFHT